MIHEQRIRTLRDGTARRGGYVLYWMQASCRAEGNHALEYAVREANRLNRPLLTCFGLSADSPEANARHYTFLLEGLRDASRALDRRGIPLVVRRGSPDAVAQELAKDACLVVTDRGYLRIQRRWRSRLATGIACPLVQVESDVLVPVETALDREAYSAAVLRPRLHALYREFLAPVRPSPLRRGPPARVPRSLSLDDIPGIVRDLGVDPSVPAVAAASGGAVAAGQRLESFLERGLRHYHTDRNDPALQGQSGLSPYLHFGHISTLQIALAIGRRRGPGVAAFLEELIVRRELSMNFAHFNANYDRIECLPAWCRATLHQHARDGRSALYSPDDLEQARTHDPFWNAAQLEMVLTGTMHGYMRMYWGKKILEWSARPEEGFAEAVRLNNRHQLDGHDPNSFAGVAWCFGKHDRPWAERPIFGLVRYMNENGLKRKFGIDAYVRRIDALRQASTAPLAIGRT